MKEILKEIIENNPELKKDEAKIEKAINLLNENNPKIYASIEFKNNLKEKIKNLINLKEWKKTRFSFFAIPVFSFLFAIWWFMYYFSDVDFFWKSEDFRLQKFEKISEKNFVNEELNEIDEIFEEVLNEEEIRTTSSIMMKWSRNIEPESSQINSDIEPNLEEIEIFSDEIFEDITNYSEMFDIESFDGSSDIKWFEESTDVEIQPMMMRANFMPIEEVDFKTFCENQIWELIWSWETEKCIVDKKECLISDYQNWICEFK